MALYPRQQRYAIHLDSAAYQTVDMDQQKNDIVSKTSNNDRPHSQVWERTSNQI